jgi:hypothetical protein
MICIATNLEAFLNKQNFFSSRFYAQMQASSAS